MVLNINDVERVGQPARTPDEIKLERWTNMCQQREWLQEEISRFIDTGLFVPNKTYVVGNNFIYQATDAMEATKYIEWNNQHLDEPKYKIRVLHLY